MIDYVMKRDFYKSLDQWKTQKQRKPLILRGARQVGKTYGIKDWGSKVFKQVIYLNFEKDKNLKYLFSESLDSEIIISKISTYMSINFNIANDLLFLDEVQLCGEALNSLKYFNEEKNELAVIAAGSLLGLVLNQEPFPVGKVQFLDIYPMTFREFLQAQDEDNLLNEAQDKNAEYLHNHLIEKLKHYLITGGAPEIVAQYIQLKPKSGADFEVIRARQEDLINSYLADMAKHCGKLNSMSLERFWRNIPEQLAREQSKSSRFIFKDVLPKKNKYSQMVDVLDWLETAGLIYRIQIVNQGLSPLAAYTKESFFKLYIFDVGILNALSGLSPSTILRYDFGTFKGYLLENFVLQNLIFLFGKKIFSWTEATSEIDFLNEINGNLLPIEVKSGINLKAKSLKQFILKYQPKKALRFSLQSKKELEPSISKKSNIIDLPIYLCGEKSIYADTDC
jgi:predicted AAA+ superfamily ATPase